MNFWTIPCLILDCKRKSNLINSVIYQEVGIKDGREEENKRYKKRQSSLTNLESMSLGRKDVTRSTGVTREGIVGLTLESTVKRNKREGLVVQNF